LYPLMNPEVAFRFDDSHDRVARRIEILEALHEVITDNVEVFTVTVFNLSNEKPRENQQVNGEAYAYNALPSGYRDRGRFSKHSGYHFRLSNHSRHD